MCIKIKILFIMILASTALFPGILFSGELTAGPGASPATSAYRVKAIMCEGIRDNLPVNPTLVFSVANRNAYCWSEFDPVRETRIIHHLWYRKDTVVARVKLRIQPPRWSTYSSIRLRDTDKGPWRVDILGHDGRVLKSLRFSIAD